MKREPKDDRKVYQTPKLTAYGNLRALTQTKQGTKNDGGGGKPNTRMNGNPNT